MKKEDIKLLALKHGFKLKKQPDGSWDLNPYVYEFAMALLAPAAEMKIPERWKLVPVEPTEKMERNAWVDSDCKKEPLSCKRIYKAMLAVAPTLEQEEK